LDTQPLFLDSRFRFWILDSGFRIAELEGMKTLLVRREGRVPPKMREILRKGSTELKEVSADEERDATTLEADRVVLWNDGEIELCATRERGGNVTRLRWPQDEDKLRMFFQTGA
jgi:hypothetical protein